MGSEWLPQETSTYQDHVIAHVVGTTVLGSLVLDQAMHLLLDIGFIWTIYPDGEMALLPQAVAVADWEAEDAAKRVWNAEIQRLHDEGLDAGPLDEWTPAPAPCLVREVNIYAQAERRRIVIVGEDASLLIESSVETCEMRLVRSDDGLSL